MLTVKPDPVINAPENESLTPYRRKLFGKINEFKRTNKWKYIWTVNGKIL